MGRVGREGKGLKLGVILIVAATVLVVGVTGMVRGWELQRRGLCCENLKAIRAALLAHADEGTPRSSAHTIQSLIERGHLAPARVTCLSARTSNYVVVLPAPSANAGKIVAAYEPKSNHGGRGGAVVFADGGSAFVPGSDYDALIATIHSGPPSE